MDPLDAPRPGVPAPGSGLLGAGPLVHNPNNPVTVSVQRVLGPFPGVPSAVVKTLAPDREVVVPHWVAGNEAHHWNLWNRELLAYRSDLVNSFASTGLRAPRLLDLVEQPDGSVSLWLEDVAGRTGADLTLADHERISRRLGEAQGRLVVRGPLVDNPGEPDVSTGAGSWVSVPWLSRGWIRQYASSRPPGVLIYDDAAAWEHPVVVDGFGPLRHEIRRRFGELYRRSGQLFDLLESLPQTLCHLDYWPNNAIAADDGTDVLIDWGFVGWGAVGEDPGNWIPDTVFDHFMKPDQLPLLEETVWSAYRDGLERSGWQLPLEVARLGICASAVKYIWLPGLMVNGADHVGPTAYGGQDGFPLVEVFARRAPVFLRLLEWVEEADRLVVDLADARPELASERAEGGELLR